MICSTFEISFQLFRGFHDYILAHTFSYSQECENVVILLISHIFAFLFFLLQEKVKGVIHQKRGPDEGFQEPNNSRKYCCRMPDKINRGTQNPQPVYCIPALVSVFVHMLIVPQNSEI